MKKKGFTLIELMVVVAVIGILASVAIPMFSRYMKKAKTAEAPLNLRKIYDGQIVFYQGEHPSAAGTLMSKQFAYCAPQPAIKPGRNKHVGNWEDRGWPLIKFAADGPVQYVYLVEVAPDPVPSPPARPAWIPALGLATPPSGVAGFAARAVGDLDEDSTMAEFMRVASVNTVTGEIEGGAGVSQLDPEE